MTTEICFFALKSENKKVLDRGRNMFYCEDNNNRGFSRNECFHNLKWTPICNTVRPRKMCETR